MGLLTVKELRAMKEGERLPESAGRGAGTLRFRKTGDAVRVYFRYTGPDGKRFELPIGLYDESGRDGMTLIQVSERAGELRKQYQSGSGDLRGELDEREAARIARINERARAEAEVERKAQERARFTLSALCGEYAAMLEARGKVASGKHARSMFKHVPDELAGLPANEITAQQIAVVIRRVREDGKERTAGVLRSYLRAAYGAAIRAPFDASLPADLIPFNVEMNPVDAVPAIAVRAGNRTLSREELRAYMGLLGMGSSTARCCSPC